MKLRTGLVLSAVVAGGTLAWAPADASAQTEPKDNMWTRSATLYLSQAQSNPNPEEKRQRYEEALNVSMEGIENEPDNPQSYFQAGRALLGMGDFLRADSMFTQAEEIWPEYVEETQQWREFGWVQAYNAAIPALNAGNYDEAAQQLERAHTIYRGRPEAMLNLGQVYSQQGNDERAMEMYSMALEVMRGPAFEQQDSVTQANWRENEVVAVFNVAQLHASAGQYPEAAAAYESFLETDPGNTDALSNLAIVLINMEMPDSAQAIYERLLGSEGMGAREYFNAGIGLFQGEQYELSAMAFEKVVEVTPDSRDANYNLAQALYLIEDYERLIPVGERLLTLDPYNVNSHTFYVRALLMSGDEESAQVAYDHMESLPIEVHGMQVQPSATGGTVVGQVENRMSEEGTTVSIRVHFLSDTNEELGTVDVDVQLTALETSTPFQAEVESEIPVLGYWYEVTSEIPTVELPEEEADTTGTGN
jgi:tetratricopeptide (TPR) repeat protein